MLSLRSASRERVIVLGGIAMSLVIISLLVFVVPQGQEEATPLEEMSRLEQIRSRIPTASELNKTTKTLEDVSQFLLQHRVRGASSRQQSVAIYDPSKPIIASQIRFDDPGIGTVLVLRWEFPFDIEAGRAVAIFRSRAPGTVGDRVATLPASARSWVDWNVEHSVPFAYTVQALGDSMDPSALGLQSVGQAFDRTPPPPPGNVVVATGSSPARVRLSWEIPTDDGVIGVNIYRSPDPGKLGDRVAQRASGTQWEDAAVGGGTRYYYTVTSVDRAGNESSVRFQPSAARRDDPFTPPVAPSVEKASPKM